MQRRHWTFLVLALLVTMSVFCGGVAAVVKATSGAEKDEGGKVRIGVVEIKGMIDKDDEILKDLRHFREDDEIKAIVLRVDTPGGAVSPSQEIHDAVLRTEKTKPVVVSMGNLAASGGYYIAVAADKIYAEPGTLTASIGVIAEMPQVDALLETVKVKVNVYRSGKFKDLGSPLRPPTDDDRKLFQGIIDDTYEQFLAAVAEGRHLKVEEVRPIADGRVMNGRQAKEHKLIDEYGGLEEAAKGAVVLAKASGEPKLVYPSEDFKFALKDLMRDESRAAVEGVRAGFTRNVSNGLLFLSPVGGL